MSPYWSILEITLDSISLTSRCGIKPQIIMNCFMSLVTIITTTQITVHHQGNELLIFNLIYAKERKKHSIFDLSSIIHGLNIRLTPVARIPS